MTAKKEGALPELKRRAAARKAGVVHLARPSDKDLSRRQSYCGARAGIDAVVVTDDPDRATCEPCTKAWAEEKLKEEIRAQPLSQDKPRTKDPLFHDIQQSVICRTNIRVFDAEDADDVMDLYVNLRCFYEALGGDDAIGGGGVGEDRMKKAALLKFRGPQ